MRNLNYSDINQNIEKLLASAGIKGHVDMTPIASGRNNQVFKLIVGNNCYLAKAYFQSERDLRDRLGTEFSFISFAWNNGLFSVPQPIASDATHNLGIYEFVEGRRLKPGEVDKNHVQQALSFYLGLNERKNEPAARRLPLASESCLSLAHHSDCVERRLRHLLNIEVHDVVTREASQFVRGQLSPAWEFMKNDVKRHAEELSLEFYQDLLPEDLCLSPSDFGFHNAILEDTGALRFIDFEYAGWDDPAKLVCDFFRQLEVPVPLKYFKMFTHFIAKQSSNPKILMKRIKLLLPVYHLKWCTIIMNDFLPTGSERRQFAQQKNVKARKKKQLEKVRSYFANFSDSLTLMGESNGIY